MPTSKNKVLHRLSVMLLALVVIISVLPASGMTTFAAGAEDLTETVTATIDPADIDIDITANSLTYNENEQELVILSGGFEDGDIAEWSVNGTVIEGNEIPKAVAVGEYTVKLTVSRGPDYNTFEKTVTAVISEGDLKLDGLTVTGLEGVYTEKDGEPVEQEAVEVENQGDYDLEYQLDDGDGIVNEDGWTDTIPVVTDAGSYIVWVRAVKDGYNDSDVDVTPAAGAGTPYNVYIAKAEPDFNFNNYSAQKDGDPAEQIMLSGSLPYGKTFDFSAADTAVLGDRTITYEIELDEEGIASIDDAGLLTIDYPGEVKVTAALSGNDNYNECKIEYKLEITGSVSAEGQYISFESSEVDYILGTSVTVSENAAVKQDDRIRGDITYSMESVAGLSIDTDTGKITVDDYDQLADAVRSSGGTLKAEVTAVKTGTLRYGKDKADYILQISFEEIPESPYVLSGTAGTGGWYKTSVTVTPAAGYSVAETAGGTFTENVVFSDQGTDTRYVCLRNMATGGITDRIGINIKIDSEPAQNLSIEFSEPTFLQRLGQITGFYNPDITITFSAEDATSGIDHFDWTYTSENGETVTEKIAVTVDGSKAVARLVLPADEAEQLHGRISFTATDKASNTIGMEDDYIFIVDTISPGLSVKYQSQTLYEAQIDTRDGVHFFNSDVTVELTVSETNFSSGDVVVLVSENGAAAAKVTPSWNDRTGTFTLAGDGDYQVFVKYTDRSGNSMEDYASEIITVDTTAPEISVGYSEAVETTGDMAFYNGNVNVAVSIEEANFYADDVRITVSKDGDSAAAVTPSWTDGYGGTHTGRLTLTGDGHYVVKVDYTDRSGNTAAVYTSREIIIDTVEPVINVAYNSSPVNESDGVSYYDGGIGGTILITEANFYSEDVSVTVSRDGGPAQALPVAWSDSGTDAHTGTFALTVDADYIVTVTYTDRSGNVTEDYASGRITLDTRIDEPVYTINSTVQSGDNGGAYNDAADVTFSFGDQNFDTVAAVLTRTRFDKVEDVTDEFIEVILNDKGGSASFSVSETIGNDGIYLLTVTMTDKAGHTAESYVRFTVNRFGSVYVYGDYLCSLIKNGGQYIGLNGDAAVTEDLVITEYNADQIAEDSLKVTITRDGELIDAEYTASPVSSAGWYEYVYTISRDNFTEDGVYAITISSEDTAGNASTSIPENSVDEDGAGILDVMIFTVDTTAPGIRNIVNLEEKFVNAPKLDVRYTIVDTGGLAKIEIYVDGQMIDTVSDFGDDRNNFTGSFTLYESRETQTVRLVVTDLAGNITDTGDDSFDPGDLYVFNDTVTVSTNVFVRWYANTPLFRGSVAAAAAVAAGVILLAAKKRRRKENKEAT